MAGNSNAKTTGLCDRRNDDVSVGEVESPLTGRARITPIMPAANASAEDSARNDVMMASGLNPNARNVPISVVRADTAAHIVFIAAKMAAKAMIPATNNPSTRRALVRADIDNGFERSPHSRERSERNSISLHVFGQTQ
jgi:hypothetical protein